MFGTGYAITDEIHQIFVPDRAFQLSDILVDSTGALIGVIASFIMLKIILYIGKRRTKNGNS
jgi:VanZ family protein